MTSLLLIYPECSPLEPLTLDTGHNTRLDPKVFSKTGFYRRLFSPFELSLHSTVPLRLPSNALQSATLLTTSQIQHPSNVSNTAERGPQRSAEGTVPSSDSTEPLYRYTSFSDRTPPPPAPHTYWGPLRNDYFEDTLSDASMIKTVLLIIITLFSKC